MGDKQLGVGSIVGGRYTIESVLGRGGLATVYRARDESLGRAVAVKIIDASGADGIERERSEIQLLASLGHPALVTLFDAGTLETDLGPRSALVMELVDGPDLGARLTRGPIAHADLVRLASDIAEALHVVHARGIVHRDVKPGNVLLAPSVIPTYEFTAKLADFGIAYLVDATRLTATGTLIGTAAYLSPEQAAGHPPAPASDIYSLGLVILEALTGERAFPGSLAESVAARLSRDPEIPATVAPAWRDLIGWMTAREPDGRPTALDVAEAARGIASAAHTPSVDDATAPMESEYARTRVMDAQPASTRLLESVPTERLGGGAAASARAAASTAPAGPAAPASPASPAAPASPARRWRLVAALAAVALVAAGIVATVLAQGDGAPPETAPTPPAVEGDLGVHLDELFEAVTP